MQRFQGKTALVTGAGSGIGRSIAHRFAKEGADVVGCDVNTKGIEETVRLIEHAGKKALGCVCDIGRQAEVDNMAMQVFKSFDRIDILVNNAGIGDTNKSFDEIDAELWDRIYAVNVKGPFFLTQKIARHMIDNKIKGRIINISSTEGKTNRAGSLVYASSKSALIGLTQGLAFQLAGYDITVNAVCPGLIDTPIWHRGDKALEMPEGSTIKMVVDSSIESMQVKIQRVGRPDDIAGAVAFLASEDAGYMTGQALNVCGGLEYH